MRFANKSAPFIIGCFVLALVFLAPPVIHGDEWNLSTRFSINQPFQVPGMVLQPNTKYVIRLHDSPAERNVVQIFNEEQSKLLTMFIAISDERMQPTDDTKFTFMETAPGYPIPIKEWFYPGRLRGLEFVYPKEQASEIARHGRDSSIQTAAIFTKSENTAVLEEKPSVAESTPSVEEKAELPNEESEVQIAQNDNSSTLKSESEEVQREKPAETQAATEPARTEELPRTAGELPLIALIGALCVASGLGLKALSSSKS